jgi:hypothetical protein
LIVRIERPVMIPSKIAPDSAPMGAPSLAVVN